jgi:glucosamine--fructose-6-phosphate aminotransferase (isomerizing)
MSPIPAAEAALARLHGAFALVLLFAGHDDLLVCARRGSPLAIGYGDGDMYVGSDALALALLTDRIQYLEEGDWAVITPRGATIYGSDGAEASRQITQTAFSGALIGKGNYRHFMHKEIHEQPAVLGDTLHAFASPAEHRITLPELPIDFAAIPRLAMIACGTASYACMVARYWFEQLAGLPVDLDIGSEFRYRGVPLVPGSAALFVSQSGETMDTLEAMRCVKAAGLKTIALVNVPESTLAREADCHVRTLAGPEIGVASTKAFTTQLATLACLAVAAARARGRLTPEREAALTQALDEVPARAAEVLLKDAEYEQIAHELVHARDVLYLGRGTSYAIALEGALKLKEISYIHAEGYPAGEMKHGPIALIDPDMPVVAIATGDRVYDKVLSNMQEVGARDGIVIAVTDRPAEELEDIADEVIQVPRIAEWLQPIVNVVPLQLLAYHVGVRRGADVDQPRNLAKSVTVE